jgi:tetratricopeptide (TPR) repeat protein
MPEASESDSEGVQTFVASVAEAEGLVGKLQAELPEVPLRTAQGWLAKMFGFNDYHELVAVADQPTNPLKRRRPDDSQQLIDKRRDFQAQALAYSAGLAISRAFEVVDVLTPYQKIDVTDLQTKIKINALWLDVYNLLETKKYKEAVDTALKAIRLAPNYEFINECIESVAQSIFLADRAPPNFIKLLRYAADHGSAQLAYSAANCISEAATSPEEFTEAERMYLFAIEATTSPKIRAACYVNYATIVRDGKISGKEDWKKAISLYESAAKLGMVVGMFNAGNVSGWLGNAGEPEYLAHAAKWYQYALDWVAAGKETLDFNGDEEFKVLIERCTTALAGGCDSN